MPGRILITGASGLIGGAISAGFAAQGRRLRVSSRTPERIAGRFADIVRMPAPAAGAEAWMPMLDGVSDIVHCAGIADAGGADGERAFFDVNVGLTRDLAAAAAARGTGGKFVFLSSIRAVAGASAEGVVDEETPPDPQDAYGRSKLEAEAVLRAAFAPGGRFTILRPVPVYGGGEARGNLRRLLRIAALPAPLPLAGLSGRRSLLDLDACVGAVGHVLSCPETDGGTYVVADARALSVAEILAALRRGLGRSPSLFSLPEPFLERLAALAGRSPDWDRLAGSLVADARALAATGWTPEADTAGRLARFAAEIEAYRPTP